MLEQARKFLENKDHEQCFCSLKEHWLKHRDDVEAVRLMAELMSAVGKDELAEKLTKLSASQDALRSDAQNLFEAGFQLIDERQPELAAILLERCVELVPDEPTANYELGFALLSLKRYRESIPYLDRALKAIDDFDTRLNLAVAYTCTRNSRLAREMIGGLAACATSDQEVQELNHQRVVLKRLAGLENRKELSGRDWLYIHYGSLLLKQNDMAGSGGKFGPVMDNYSEVARTLLLLRGVLEGLGAEFDVVEYYSSLSRPLSHALAELLGLPFELYGGPNREERALLLMGWASDIIGPHQSFVTHEPKRSIFSYALTWREPLPIAPELVGCLSEACALPWGERFAVEQWDDGRPARFERLLEEPEGPVVSAQKILEAASDLESDPDVLNSVQETVAYYSAVKGNILLGNSKTFTTRPEYTNELA